MKIHLVSRITYLLIDRPLWFLLPLMGITAWAVVFTGLLAPLCGMVFWWSLAAVLLVLSWYRGRWGLYILCAALPLFGDLPFRNQSHYLVLLTVAFLAGAYGCILLSAPRIVRLRTWVLLRNRDGGLLLITLWLLATLFGLLGLPLLTAWRDILDTSFWFFFKHLLMQTDYNPAASLRVVAFNILAILTGIYVYLEIRQRGNGLRFGIYLFTALATGLLISISAGLLEYFELVDLSFLRTENVGGFDSKRITGFFVNPGWHAEYLAMLMPVLPVLLHQSALRQLPRSAQTALLIFLLIAGEVCIILSMQRGAWLSYPPTLLLIWIAFYYALDKIRYPDLTLLSFLKSRWMKVLITIPLSVSLSVYIVYGLKQYQHNRDKTAYAAIVATTNKASRVLEYQDRAKHWTPSLIFFSKNPIYGGGGDSYGWQTMLYYDRHNGDLYRHPSYELGIPFLTSHNMFLQVLTGRGMLGFLFFTSLLMLAFYRLLATEFGFIGGRSLPNSEEFGIHLVRLCAIGSLLASTIYGLVQEILFNFNLQLAFWIVLFAGLGVTRPPPDPERRQHLRHSFGFILALMLLLLPFHLVNQPYIREGLRSILTAWKLPTFSGALDTSSNTFLVTSAVLGISLFTSLIYLFVINQTHKSGFFIDDQTAGRVQQVHRNPTPRIGGLGLFMANLFTVINPLGWKLILCMLPAFIAGVIDDYRTLSARMRLILQSFSAMLLVWLFGITPSSIGFNLSLPLFMAVPVTILAVVGLINAINIIDGFNGLASGVSLMIFSSLTVVCWMVGDLDLIEIMLINFAGLTGFLVLNYPHGRIFLGDGGSYFLGFLIAAVSLLIIGRHPHISPLYPLTICAYPVFEVLFSIYRRRMIRNANPTHPDHLHLHSLIYRRWTRNNPKTSLLIWCGVLPFIVAGTVFYKYDTMQLIILVAFVITYLAVYRRLARFSLDDVVITGNRWLKNMSKILHPVLLITLLMLAACNKPADKDAMAQRMQTAAQAAKWLIKDGACPVPNAPQEQCLRLLQSRVLLALDATHDGALKQFLDEHAPRLDESPESMFFEGYFALGKSKLRSIEFASGWSHREPEFRWSNERVARLGFKEALPKPVVLRFRAHAFGMNAQFPFLVTVGEEKQLVDIAQEPRDFTLKFSNPHAARVVEIIAPYPISPFKLGISKDPRHLGLGLWSFSAAAK